MKAVDLLRKGLTVACPTEGIWGLSCDPFNLDAVTKLLALKARSSHKGLILIGSDLEQFSFITKGLTEQQQHLLASTQVPPTTWLVPHHSRVPSWISGGGSKVAIRITQHPIMADICQCFGSVLVSTSANPTRLPPAVTRDQVCAYFSQKVTILEGETLAAYRGRPSDIRDLITNEQLR